ncbi:hypothetical protein RB195_017156 [Necator americanus]
MERRQVSNQVVNKESGQSPDGPTPRLVSLTGLGDDATQSSLASPSGRRDAAACCGCDAPTKADFLN